MFNHALVVEALKQPEEDLGVRAAAGLDKTASFAV